MRTLMVLEVSQKQNYIFRTNKLKENIGASMIIRHVTEELPDDMIESMQLTSQAGCVFKGGGKSVYEFATRDAARTFAETISYKVCADYPGAELFLATLDYDPQSQYLYQCIDKLYSLLEVKKSERRHSFALHGLGIAQRCADSQAPAVMRLNERDSDGHVTDNRFISAECKAKIKMATGRDAFFAEILPSETYRFADEFKELGGTYDVKNMIAVIVIDGNKMGAKIRQFRDNYKAAIQGTQDYAGANRLYSEHFDRLSQELDRRYRNAVKDAAATLKARLPELRKNRVVSVDYDEVELKDILPMRPLILSGDDICIVCDARIGIELATEILRNIDRETIDVEGTEMELHACAGIAMVHTSYPFFRAHELAEELCNNAKSILPANDSRDESVLDFMIVQGEIAGSLSDIRREHYNGGLLTAKPYYLKDSIDSESGAKSDIRVNSLPYFQNRLAVLKKQVSRGTLKEYRVALAKGESSAIEFVNRMGMGIGAGTSYAVIEGEAQRHCIDFDVIEMMDLYHGWEDQADD